MTRISTLPRMSLVQRGLVLQGEITSHVLMTRDGFMFLAMGFTGAQAGALKEAFLARFNAMEAELAARAMPTIPALPQTFAEALQLAADNQRQVEAQAAQIAALTPRSEALAAIADAEGLSNVTVTAKTLQVPPGELWAYLRRERWVYKRGDGIEVAMQAKIDAGCLTHKTVTLEIGQGRTRAKPQIMVTPKGLTVLATRLRKPLLAGAMTPLLPHQSAAQPQGGK